MDYAYDDDGSAFHNDRWSADLETDQCDICTAIVDADELIMHDGVGRCFDCDDAADEHECGCGRSWVWERGEFMGRVTIGDDLLEMRQCPRCATINQRALA